MNAADFIIQSANKYPGKLGIIAIGPLTNLAVAYHFDNSIVDKISIVSIMGGSITGMGIRHFFSS
jgi:purine nucleosidase